MCVHGKGEIIMTKKQREKQQQSKKRKEAANVIEKAYIMGLSPNLNNISKGAGDAYINIKQNKTKEEKRQLAQHIVRKYIEDLYSVAVDTGSTLQQIIEEIMKTRNFLSILTNNMTAFRQNSTQRVAESANEFILTGGKYVTLFDALLGNETFTSFDLFNPNVVIIGVSGLIAEMGFFCHGNDEVNVKKLLFNKKAARILIPVDYSKLGRSDSYLFGKTKDFKDRASTECIVVMMPPRTNDTKKDDSERIQRQIYVQEKQRLIESGVIVDEVPWNSSSN